MHSLVSYTKSTILPLLISFSSSLLYNLPTTDDELTNRSLTQEIRHSLTVKIFRLVDYIT